MNDDFVYIVKSAGRYHVLGSEDYRTTTTPNGLSGDTPGSAKGVTFTIDSPDVSPLPVYEGTIETSEGTLNCKTGEFTPAA